MWYNEFMPRCDVVIPIYNAYDAVIECIDSVLKNTDFSKAHLILIDDKSPDERILPLLEKYASENADKITLLKNEVNLGFVGTVNKGMKYSKNDVLLLNSDTEVSKGWLDKIMECAYSDETIATVTPLSNNATLASVPKMFVRNELPSGYTLDSMNKLIVKYSDKLYPELPTAHGFCMYIKRTALETVGYFDEENFGKGYGEENDFSFRCFQYGLKNVLCDTVYVLHKESQSFQDNKVDNSASLAKKHPELKNGLDYWCRIRDISQIGDNVAVALGVQEERANILMVIHDFSNIEQNVGGTTLHLLDIIGGLRDKYNIHVLSPENGAYKVHSFFKETDVVTAMYEKPIIIEPIGLYSNVYKRMIEDILDKYKIFFVHIHHMIGQFYDIGRVCHEKKIKYAVTLHDMYLNEPIVSMLDAKVVGGKKNYPIMIDAWRKANAELMDGATKVIAPSEFVKKEYEKNYKNLKIEVIPHGVDVEKIENTPNLSEVKNVAFVGAIFPHKGSEILEEMVEKLNSSDNVKVHLFGMTTANAHKKGVLVNHGGYTREELPQKLKDENIQLLCAFSLAPESFSYTVEEVVAAGVPVLTFDIGAGAERVKENNLGWVIKYTNDVNKIIEKIKQILNNERDYKEKVDAISQYAIRNVSEMVADYDKIYGNNVMVGRLEYKKIAESVRQADFVMDMLRLNAGQANYRDDYLAIINSRKWRLVSKVKIPKKAKTTLKKIYHKIKG